MYSRQRYTFGVHDNAARYGGPVPAEPFPAAGVLQDLTAAAEADVPWILARYAALRSWMLKLEGEPRALADHGRSAARAHLEALGGAPGAAARAREKEALGRLVEAGGRGDAAGALEEAAELATSCGHAHGARALREAAHRTRWPRSGFPPQSTS